SRLRGVEAKVLRFATLPSSASDAALARAAFELAKAIVVYSLPVKTTPRLHPDGRRASSQAAITTPGLRAASARNGSQRAAEKERPVPPGLVADFTPRSHRGCGRHGSVELSQGSLQELRGR